jgi:hypothetical protein
MTPHEIEKILKKGLSFALESDRAVNHTDNCVGTGMVVQVLYGTRIHSPGSVLFGKDHKYGSVRANLMSPQVCTK